MLEESRMFADQCDCAIIFSWPIASEPAPRAKGFKEKLVTPCQCRGICQQTVRNAVPISDMPKSEQD